MIRRRVIVYGVVQGVFFRQSCKREALRHRVAGWVWNSPDGSVEAVFEGRDCDVRQLLSWCRRGPEDARVRHVEVIDEVPAGESGFTIR